MKFLSRLVWSEGMHLGPQHFQAQTRYFEDSVQFATASLWYQTSGFLGLEFDREAIRNGTVSVRHVRGIFPDGLSFDMPESDALPEARNITEVFPPSADRLLMYLGIPRRTATGQNCVVEGNGKAEARFIGALQVLYDETTGGDEKPVRLGRKNVRLLLESEVTDEIVALAVARVLRDGTGHFIYDDKFVPPCLRISSSERLMTILRRLVEILEEKSSMLSRDRRGSGKFQANMSSGDVAHFWFLHTVNSSLSALRHLVAAKAAHPEELFRELSRLGGALCTFGLDTHPRSLPVYDHNNLEACFDKLDEHIRRHLEIVVPTRAIYIPLTAAGDYFYEGEVVDQRCFGRSRWILGVHARMGEAELILKAPQLIKVCSAKFVPELVRRALPGMAFDHLRVPPSAISARVDSQYFALNRSGPCWEHVVATKQVGVYVPGEIPDVELELLVLLET